MIRRRLVKGTQALLDIICTSKSDESMDSTLVRSLALLACFRSNDDGRVWSLVVSIIHPWTIHPPLPVLPPLPTPTVITTYNADTCARVACVESGRRQHASSNRRCRLFMAMGSLTCTLSLSLSAHACPGAATAVAAPAAASLPIYKNPSISPINCCFPRFSPSPCPSFSVHM